MRPGVPERQEHEYIRQGTLSLIANRNVAAGQILAPSLGPTRTRPISPPTSPAPSTPTRTPPGSSWPITSTPTSQALVRLVAARCGLAADLGVQGRAGVLRSQARRARVPG